MAKKTPPGAPPAPPPKPGPAPAKAPDPPKPEKCVKLTDEQRLKLDAQVWKSRALRYQAELAQKKSVEVHTRAHQVTEDATAANSAFLALAEGYGINVDQAFEWNDKGDVVYFDEQGNKLKKG